MGRLSTTALSIFVIGAIAPTVEGAKAVESGGGIGRAKQIRAFLQDAKRVAKWSVTHAGRRAKSCTGRKDPIGIQRFRLVRKIRQMLREVDVHAPAGVKAQNLGRLKKAKGKLAVLWDIYGTLFTSAAGEIGADPEAAKAERCAAGFKEAMRWSGLGSLLAPTEKLKGGTGEKVFALFREIVAQHHAASKGLGIEFPEVDIRDVWKDVLHAMVGRKQLRWTGKGKVLSKWRKHPFSQAKLEKLAVIYEMVTNPAWTMPEARETLEALQTGEVVAGIASNAQFLTPLVFEVLFGKTPEEFGFAPERTIYSYRIGEAKPSTRMYEELKTEMDKLEIPPGNRHYVGNDVRNDIGPSQEQGFRGVFFAGDEKSYRPRQELGVKAHVTITRLNSLLSLIGDD